MTAFQRTLAIVACLFLIVQTIRHAYVLWLQPRASVLDRYDQPLKDEIAAAASLGELVRVYQPVRQEADRIKAERRQAGTKNADEYPLESEPFKSEHALREAITGWEGRAKEIQALRFYWFVGLLLAGLGSASYVRGGRWLGLTLLIAGFSEIVYWTSPTFLGGEIREFDRLLVNKLAFSSASLVLLALAIRLLGAFKEQRPAAP